MDLIQIQQYWCKYEYMHACKCVCSCKPTHTHIHIYVYIDAMCSEITNKFFTQTSAAIIFTLENEIYFRNRMYIP